MSADVVKITGPHSDAPSQRYRLACSCGWTSSVPAVATAAVVWTQHVKEAA